MKHMIALIVSTLVVVVGNTIASKLYLYYTTWWADVVMHFLGGAWMVIAGATFAYGLRRSFSFATACGIALVVGIAWEVFELWFNLITLSDWIDSLADLVLDVLGGVVAYRLLDLGTVPQEESEQPQPPVEA